MITFFKRIFGRAQPKSPWNNREPIREELFSVERLEEHARSLAIAQPVASGASRGSPLAGRLANNAAALLEAHRKIAKAIDEGRTITPAAEWLIDNYHLVEKQIREIRADLPPGYYRQLPKLADGPFAGRTLFELRGTERAAQGETAAAGDAASLAKLVFVQRHDESLPHVRAHAMPRASVRSPGGRVP